MQIENTYIITEIAAKQKRKEKYCAGTLRCPRISMNGNIMLI